MSKHQSFSKVDKRERDLVALSSPYGEEEEIEEERDWGNDTQGAEDMMPSDFDAMDKEDDTMIQENAPSEDPLDNEGFDEGVLSRRSTDPDIDQVAQVQGRREQSRDIRTSTQAPGMSSMDRSTISTDRVRRSRTPKTSLQSQRQREATNNLRTRVAKVNQASEGQFEYYEDYLASLSGEPVVEDDKPEAAPERKRYTKQRRRPVSQDHVKKDDTAMNDQAVTAKRRSVKRRKDGLKQQDSQTIIDNQSNYGNGSMSNQVIRPAPSAPVDQPRPKKIRQKKLVDNETTEKTNNVARRVVAKQQTKDASPRPVVITSSMIKKPSVQQPTFQNAPKTYVADMTSPGASDDNDEDYEDDDEDEDGDEGEDGALTTDRGERPNWYERMTDQRHERSVQARVRAAEQGQAPHDRGYPSIPQYTSGNTTPRAR